MVVLSSGWDEVRGAGAVTMAELLLATAAPPAAAAPLVLLPCRWWVLLLGTVMELGWGLVKVLSDPGPLGGVTELPFDLDDDDAGVRST